MHVMVVLVVASDKESQNHIDKAWMVFLCRLAYHSFHPSLEQQRQSSDVIIIDFESAVSFVLVVVVIVPIIEFNSSLDGIVRLRPDNNSNHILVPSALPHETATITSHTT
jgi:hypothetical protein